MSPEMRISVGAFSRFVQPLSFRASWSTRRRASTPRGPSCRRTAPPDALRQQHTLLQVRLELEPERLPDDSPLRTHVPMLGTGSDPPSGNPHCKRHLAFQAEEEL